jgi:[acyl-carrier-protein] S-malonyltransferase
VLEKQTKQAAKFAFVFPGQGSQQVGMGHALCQSSPEARAVFEEADAALGMSLSQLCFEGPESELRQTINAQPAIMTTSIACLRAAAATNGAVTPAFVAGHSLGEYTALVAANVIGFADALRLVRERGRLMQEAGEIEPGGMAAIIGLDHAVLDEVCRETGAEVSNLNCPGQTVISGSKEALARAMDLAKARGAARVVPLQVSGAFHSRLMRPTKSGMARAISRVEFRTPEVPIVANSTAQPLTSADEVKRELMEQLCHCVLWQRSVECMVDAGVATFVEIGPGQVLSGLVKRISKKAQVLNVSDPESVRAMRL